MSDAVVARLAKKADTWQAAKIYPIKEQMHDVRGPGPLVMVGNQFQHPVNVNTGKASGSRRQGKYSHVTVSPDSRHLLAAAEVAPTNPPRRPSGVSIKSISFISFPR